MAAEVGIPILATEIEQRVALAESMTMGKTVFEWAPRSAAAREIGRFMTESHDQEIHERAAANVAHGG